MVAIWAVSTAAPGKTCEDAQLSGGRELHYPAGNERGQAGWDIGLSFRTLADMVDSIAAIRKKRSDAINRLAINLHGAPGIVDAESKGQWAPPADKILEADGLPTPGIHFNHKTLRDKFGVKLRELNSMLAGDAIVLFMGCNVGQDALGDEFLKVLSKETFPGKKVAGFKTVGLTYRQYRSGEKCTEPGMRDSNYNLSSFGNQKSEEEREKEAIKLPWASETSPNAKVALNGAIISGADPNVAKTEYTPAQYLPGTWSVTIGGWNGYFGFSKDGSCYWMTQGQGTRYPGKWTADAEAVRWSYPSDDPNFMRTFIVKLPLKSTVNGEVMVKGKNSGFFVMSKQF
jgi:hypothetical protein